MFLSAHIADDGRIQSVEEHNQNTAEYASGFLRCVGLEQTAFLTSKLHDIGKNKKEFADYLQKAVSEKGSVKRGSVNHTFAGVRWTLEQWHNGEETGLPEFTAELIAYAIGAHHGLFDCVGDSEEHGLTHRMKKQDIGYAESVRNSALDMDDFHLRFEKALDEVRTAYEKIVALGKEKEEDYCFYLGLLERLLLSALIDADRRDTAEFMQNAMFPKEPEDMRRLWIDCLNRMEAKLNALPIANAIARARTQISAQCRAFADSPVGIYRLNVPTGGGKTLSGLRFALAHAAAWNKKRILFVAPLLTIIEQNAAEIRKYIQDDSVILEHHSNVIREYGELDYLTETWSSPIIITTLVQFLKTLFDGKTGSIRRFHALSESVIILDEIQSLPPNMLTLFNLTMNFLAEFCGATIVLCSATQPNLSVSEHPIRLSEPCEIVPYQTALWETFRRTELKKAGAYQLAEIPDFIREVLTEADSMLVVCNKKDEAAFLFRELSGGVRCFHLSASMCMAHRRQTLDAVRKLLNENAEARKQGKCGTKLLSVSTQVIEAGVDISFERVVRFAAGMDSIVQAAGRCNRNGESAEPAPVYIIECAGEKLAHLKEIERGKKATVDLLTDFIRFPQKYDHDLFSAKTIYSYYQRHDGSMEEGETDYPIPKLKATMFDLLSENKRFCREENTGEYLLCQAFKTAGDAFTVFDDDTTDVIVPFAPDKREVGALTGRQAIEAFIELDRAYQMDYTRLKELLQAAKPYTLSLRKHEMDRLKQLGGVISLFEGQVMVMTDGFYDNDVGFSLKNENDYQEV